MRQHADAVNGLTEKGVSGTALDELCKLLMGESAAYALRAARDTGVLATLLPELAPMIGFDQGSRYHDLTTDEHTFKAMETACHVDAPLRVRMALLFHDSGKPEVAWTGTDGRKHYYAYTGPDPDATDAQRQDHEVVSDRLWRAAAQRLNAPRGLRNDVSTLIQNHMVPTGKRNPGVWVRRQRVVYGDDLLKDLLLHRACDLTGKTKAPTSHLRAIADMESLRQDAQAAGVPAGVKDLKITGFDAQEIGLAGKAIGEALHRVLDEVVVDPRDDKLTREWQLQRLGA